MYFYPQAEATAVPADNVSGSFNDVRPPYPAGLAHPRRKRISELLRRVWVRSSLCLYIRCSLVSAMWMAGLPMTEGHELIMPLVRLSGCVGPNSI